MQKGNIFFKKNFLKKKRRVKNVIYLSLDCSKNVDQIIQIYITSPIAWFRALLIEHV